MDYTIGKAIELRSGKDATLIGCGIMVARCLEAAELLSQKGIEVSVVDMHTIKPLDEEMIIRKARETGAILTAEEHNIIGGLGSAVCESVCANHPVPVCRMGLEDVFGQSGSPEELMQFYGLTADKIVEKVRLLLKTK